MINSSACSGHYTGNGVRCLCLCVCVACVTTLFDVYDCWCHHVRVLLKLIPVDFTMSMYITISWTCSHSHLQYLIACRMQIWRGKAIMLGRQGRHMGGGAQWRLLKPSLILSLRGLEAVSIPFIGHDTRDGLTWNGNYHCRAPPPVYRLSTWHTVSDRISQAFSLLFAYSKRSNTGGGNGLAMKPLSMCNKFGSGCIQS